MKNGFNSWITVWGVTAVICSAASVVQAGYDPGPDMNGGSATAGMVNESEAVRNADAQMLIRTLSEELTEIRELAGQQARLRQLGGSENNRIARMYGRWIGEHKAGSPLFVRLIQMHGADPGDATVLHQPRLGDKMSMLHITHMAHMEAVRTSQMRHGATNDWRVKNAMRKRANLARKHMREMTPFHDERNCPMCRNMDHDM